MNTNTKYLTAIPTVAVFLYAHIGAINLPERNISPRSEGNIMSISGTTSTTKMSWENKTDFSYKFVNESQKIAEQIKVIHNFVSVLLQESKELDPKYSKVVDKYFWDLA